MKHIWDKKQDGNRKEERSFARVAIIASCIALLFLCFKKDNIFQWIKAELTISRQNKEIAANKKKIDELDRQYYLLTEDRDSLEKYARERYHFSQKGDDVYLITE
ncbi:MAG: septum formation initiator family protein [Candidatus Cryptobacteroides sp.]